jgi:hypothetical protein
MGTTTVSISPSSSSPAPVHASMTAMQPAVAHLDFQPEKTKSSGKAVLYSLAGNSVVPIDPKSKAHKKIKLVARCQKAWDLAKAHIEKIDEFASEVAIRAIPDPDSPNRDIITVSYRTGRGELRTIASRDLPAELITKVEKIRTLVRPNRTLDVSPPLQISEPSLLAKESCAKFLETSFKSLEAGLEEPAKSSALRNIVTAEAMIQGFQMHLGGLIQHKEEEFKKTPVLPHPEYKKKEEELEKLRKLHKELDSIDRNAVFRAVATWGNLKTGTLDEDKRAELRKTADKLSLNTKKDLQEAEKTRQDTHYVKNSYIGKKLGFFKPVESSELHAYALDVGDLIIPDQWDYQNRRSETDRKDKKACVEQMIVQMMMNLLDPNMQVDPNHPVLSDFDAATTRQEIMSLIEAPLPQGKDARYFPKAYARLVYEKIGTIPSVGNTKTDLAHRLEDLKNTSGDTYRFPLLLK